MADRVPRLDPVAAAWSAELDDVGRRLRDGLGSPLDLPEVCRRARVQVEFRSPTSGARVDGSYVKAARGPLITLYRSRLRAPLSTRERFTLAHELGHWALEELSGLPSRQDDAAAERLCDRFAGRLLISDVELGPVVARARERPLALLELVPGLGDASEVSLLTAAARALDALDGGHALTTTSDGRPAEIAVEPIPLADAAAALEGLRLSGERTWSACSEQGERLMARRLRSGLHPALALVLSNGSGESVSGQGRRRDRLRGRA